MASSSRIKIIEERLTRTIPYCVLPCSPAPGRAGGGTRRQLLCDGLSGIDERLS